MGWRREFDEDYDVPEAFTKALYDASWHNDLAPRFWRRDDPASDRESNVETPQVELWVDHPDPQQREVSNDGGRFTVVKRTSESETETIIETDEVDEALQAILSFKLRPDVKSQANEVVDKLISDDD